MISGFSAYDYGCEHRDHKNLEDLTTCIFNLRVKGFMSEGKLYFPFSGLYYSIIFIINVTFESFSGL